MASSNADIRQRLPNDSTVAKHAQSLEHAKMTVLELNAAEEKSDSKEKKTFGRTPDGTVFTVPVTHDMVSQLFDPTQPKNLSDVLVIAVLFGLCALLYILPKQLRIPVFAVIYLFWRACYNAGIGWLLYQQSKYNTMVNWAVKSNVFVDPANGKNPRPAIYSILKREMETKIPKDYVFEKAPIEYNAWLVFRRVVDLILMCDFTSYCLFAIACGGRPAGESVATTIGRWMCGIALVLFNLWVKLDAHRVVKDFAWYWGDFFYLIDQELTFDGVFEMAPHPMYSVGYAGYYGISLMAGSYKVLAISIIAHAAQFAFLALVENPHIEKTYNPPPPRQRKSVLVETNEDQHGPLDSPKFSPVDEMSPILQPLTSYEPPPTKDLLGIQNFDLHRVIDSAALLIQFYFYTLAFFTPSTLPYQIFFVVNAVVCRLWYSIGIGYLLDRQSKKKKWTRHFIKYGETIEEAWRQWKGIYHLSMTMCYVSFVTAAFKMYSLPPDWSYGMATLRHVIGFALIALQLWTIISIYDSLGEFGWFFGDFFFERGGELTYSGIYRFLNNPERVIGLAGVWGFAIISWSKSIFFLAFLSHILTLCFIQFVERPHMQKRYGLRLRQESGLSKSFKRSLPASLQHWQGSVDRVLEDTADLVEEFIEATAPKIAAAADHFVKESKARFLRYPASVSITRTTAHRSLAGFDINDYSVSFTGKAAPPVAASEKVSGREGELGQHASFTGAEYQPEMLEYGAPIRVSWTAPLNHSKKDWIGLYMLADNSSSPNITRVSSQGRWIATSLGGHDGRAEQGILVSDKQEIRWTTAAGAGRENGKPMIVGEMEFAGDKLWWTTGVFEFRYHHDGKHNVMARSKPFEVRIPKFEDLEVGSGILSLDSGVGRTRGASMSSEGRMRGASINGSVGGICRSQIEQLLLPIVRNCFDRDPEIAPNTPEEPFGALVEREGKFSKRVVFALRMMFGIEFAPGVVKADGNVRNLSWRICNAKAVLAPYSMSASNPRRPSTPGGDK